MQGEEGHAEPTHCFVHINSLFNAVDIHLAHTKLALRVADERRNKGGICYAWPTNPVSRLTRGATPISANLRVVITPDMI